MKSTHVVVVLNFHGKHDTLACVGSLMDSGADVRILVVDNGSDDGIVEAVRERWPGLETIKNDENLGFAGGMNTGLRWAVGQGAETITVLNNDTLIPPGVMESLSTTTATRRAAVSPEVRYADGTERVWFGGGRVNAETGLARHLSDTELEQVGTQDGLRPSQTLAGCCVTASAETWEMVGMFDERYFLNFEDSDWSERATAAGVNLFVDPSVHIHHKVSASFTGAYSYLGLFFYTRNGLLFIGGSSGSTLRQARFLRRHVIPPLADRLRRREAREFSRRAFVVLTALWCHIVGRYGRAPARLEQRAARWRPRT